MYVRSIMMMVPISAVGDTEDHAKAEETHPDVQHAGAARRKPPV